MKAYEQPTFEVDAWDHVHSLDPEDRDDAFAIVMANFGRGYPEKNGGQITVPDEVHLVGASGVTQVEVAMRTVIELDGKGAYSGKDF